MPNVIADVTTEVLQAFADAWNRHDMRAFGSLFHEDGVWVLWTGQVWTGRKAIEEGHAQVHRTVFRNSVQRERLEAAEVLDLELLEAHGSVGGGSIGRPAVFRESRAAVAAIGPSGDPPGRTGRFDVPRTSTSFRW